MVHAAVPVFESVTPMRASPGIRPVIIPADETAAMLESEDAQLRLPASRGVPLIEVMAAPACMLPLTRTFDDSVRTVTMTLWAERELVVRATMAAKTGFLQRVEFIEHHQFQGAYGG